MFACMLRDWSCKRVAFFDMPCPCTERDHSATYCAVTHPRAGRARAFVAVQPRNPHTCQPSTWRPTREQNRNANHRSHEANNTSNKCLLRDGLCKYVAFLSHMPCANHRSHEANNTFNRCLLRDWLCNYVAFLSRMPCANRRLHKTNIISNGCLLRDWMCQFFAFP